MAAYHIKKGFDIPLEGEAPKAVQDLPASPVVAFYPDEFPFTKWQLLVAEGDRVQVGTPIAASKEDPQTLFCSSVSGSVQKIIRGERRKLLSVVMQNDGAGEAVDFGAWDSKKLKAAEPAKIIAQLKSGGMWPLIKQRPFGKIAVSTQSPKALFINAMETAPLAADQEFLLRGRDKEFALGLLAMRRIVEKEIHLCMHEECKSEMLTNAEGVEKQTFSGPHPAGLSGTHIGLISPINKGETVWIITAYQLSLIGEFLMSGKHPDKQLVAVVGPKAARRGYFRVVRGAQISNVLAGQSLSGCRAISGNALFGDAKSAEECMNWRETTVTVLEEDIRQFYLLSDKHWAGAGFKAFSSWPLFASALNKSPKRWALGTSLHGGHRAIIQQDLYERYSPLDIPITALVKSIPSENIDRLEQLGILELEPEDVALCTFVCPSKVDVAGEIAKALALVEKEG